ncbi:F-box only protein 6-like [Copidosoma floridanum]|uniref:F-box only protein 6-like n=1 Tax=Copidosoma floridanum TaxID=29053 RepID=UPI000C6F68F3|nr:F-box only protein 6-like [Copidosoma floridanum]
MIKAHQPKKKLKVCFTDQVHSPIDDHDTINGSIIHSVIIPDELLLSIFYAMDAKSLLHCHMVCRHWRYLIRNRVWYKKAELTVGQSLPLSDKIPWTAYCFICANKPFYKNLVKNHSREEGLFKYWKVTDNGGAGWDIECPPQGVKPLPADPVFENKQFCFVTSFGRCCMEQTIDLIDEGMNEYLLGFLQPTIKVSEWFCSRPNVPAVYDCTIKLLREQKSDRTAMEVLNYTKIIEKDQMNQWFKFCHEFKDYGKGLRKIKFCHSGQDRSYSNGFRGSKMAGASVRLELNI